MYIRNDDNILSIEPVCETRQVRELSLQERINHAVDFEGVYRFSGRACTPGFKFNPKFLGQLIVCARQDIMERLVRSYRRLQDTHLEDKRLGRPKRIYPEDPFSESQIDFLNVVKEAYNDAKAKGVEPTEPITEPRRWESIPGEFIPEEVERWLNQPNEKEIPLEIQFAQRVCYR